jgi:hypothetical protein
MTFTLPLARLETAASTGGPGPPGPSDPIDLTRPSPAEEDAGAEPETAPPESKDPEKTWSGRLGEVGVTSANAHFDPIAN